MNNVSSKPQSVLPIKLCLVSSSGGHLVKLMRLKPWWSKYKRIWVVRNDILTNSLLKDEEKWFGNFPENRHVVNFFKNLFLAWRFLRKEKPDMVFSLGAGIAPPFFLMAKLLGIKTVYMETFIFTPHPTLSGKLVYPWVDHFLIQNQDLQRIYPKALYKGSVL